MTAFDVCYDVTFAVVTGILGVAVGLWPAWLIAAGVWIVTMRLKGGRRG